MEYGKPLRGRHNPSAVQAQNEEVISQNKPKHLTLVLLLCADETHELFISSVREKKKIYAWKSNNINILISQYDTDDQT